MRKSRTKFWHFRHFRNTGQDMDFMSWYGQRNLNHIHICEVKGKADLKGIIHPKMKILSSFTHPQVVPNLYEFLCSAEHKGRKPGCFGAPLTSIVGKKNTMEVNGAPELLCFPHSSEYLPLCSAEQTHSYRFGTTWGWVNDDTIFIFGWTIPLRQHCLKKFIHYRFLLFGKGRFISRKQFHLF